MQYKSPITLLGVPLVHIAVGPAEGTGAVRGIAKGWIAIGDVAFGILFAAGGLAVGGLSVGGLSVGVFAVAGVSVGVWSVGGLALGVLTLGGAALGLWAATGGLAIATEYAVGGVAIGLHANDEAARAYLESRGFFGFTDAVLRFADWLIALAIGVPVIVWIIRRRKGGTV